MSTLKQNIDVKKFLPHRKPMLMVDKHLRLTETLVETEFIIKENNIFVENNNFTEVGLIENIAQTCSVIVGSSYFEYEGAKENNSDVIGFISAIKSINIYKLPKVNEVLFSSGNLISRYDGKDFSICTMSGAIYCNEELLLECQLNLFIKRN